MILGIDPGLSGALAFYDQDGFAIFDMPTFEVVTNSSKRRTLDLANLKAILKKIDPCAVLCAVLEDVHSMPKQGVASSFTFGRVVGALEGVLAALEIPVTRVAPHVWKRRLQCTHDKDATRRRASELMPRHAHLWPLKKHDGRAEAALIAYYGAHYLCSTR
jgi:hypothetical protein